MSNNKSFTIYNQPYSEAEVKEGEEKKFMAVKKGRIVHGNTEVHIFK